MVNTSDEKLRKSSTNLRQQANPSNQSIQNLTDSANRKSANSWFAQSFRKAFGKIENKRGSKNSGLNKSHYDLNSSSVNNGRVVSSMSINNQDQRNVGCLSDEENDNNDAKAHKLDDQNNESDSDYEHDKFYSKPPYKNSSLVQTKRSYRSESELAKTTSKTNSNKNSELQTKTNELESSSRNIPQSVDDKLAKANAKQQVQQRNVNLGSKFNKTHKSVSSLLSAAAVNNQTEISSPYAKLQEINESFLNQSQFSLVQKKW
jgi:hypothetical protein